MGDSRDPVRLACQFMRAHAHLDIGLDDIARAASLSNRGLQHAFKRQLDTTPLAYLRAVRLTRAHDELLATPPGPRMTVNEIARRWHFSHHSRFAALYRETYGHYPAEAMRPTATPGEGR